MTLGAVKSTIFPDNRDTRIVYRGRLVPNDTLMKDVEGLLTQREIVMHAILGNPPPEQPPIPPPAEVRDVNDLENNAES